MYSPPMSDDSVHTLSVGTALGQRKLVEGQLKLNGAAWTQGGIHVYEGLCALSSSLK